MKRTLLLAFSAAFLAVSPMQVTAQKYHVTKVQRQRILIDDKYAADKDAEAFLAPFKAKVDSLMSPVIGKSAKYMKAYTPESELSNLLADIMVWCATKYDEHVDMGLYNMGGIRAALPEGDITFGDVNDIAPFENKICFLTLTGKQMRILFQQMSRYGGGVSHGVEAVYDKDHKLLSLKMNGEDVKDDSTYRLATIDYLMHGNDGFRELQNGSNVVSPQDTKSNTRFLIADYFRQMTAEGRVVDSNVEGRVIVKE